MAPTARLCSATAAIRSPLNSRGRSHSIPPTEGGDEFIIEGIPKSEAEGEAGSELNGRRGWLLGRDTVRPGDVKALKEDNIQLLDPAAAAN